MILRGVVLGLVLVTVLLAQTVLAPILAIGGVAPDLVVLTVLVLGVVEGPGTGLRFGFVAGLATDLLSGVDGVVGVSALLLLLSGYAAGVARPYLAANQLAGVLVVAGVGTVAVIGARGLLEFLLGLGAPDAWPLARDAVLGGLYAAVLSPFAGLLLRRIPRVTATTRTPV